MKINEVMKLDELNYPGNIGVMEMFKFYQVATSEEKRHLKELMAQNKMDAAWDFLQKVSGMTLQK